MLLLPACAAAAWAQTRRSYHHQWKYPGGWFPEQRFAAEEAVRASTINNAYAAFEEKVKGSITVGKYGDLAIFSDAIFTIDPGEIASAQVEMTIVGGAVV